LEVVHRKKATAKFIFGLNGDHLGNIRLSYTDADGNGSIDPANEIVEENNYYPFGLQHKGYNGIVSPLGNSVAKKFTYNGQEFEEALGLNVSEMDLRQYDVAIGRFTSLDPVTHFSQSTYTAFDNNPIYWADPSGANSEAAENFERRLGADGLTNEQWIALSSPGGSGPDATRAQARSNQNHLAELRNEVDVEIGKGAFEDQETRSKATAFINDIIHFLLIYASYNAEIQYRRDNGMGHQENINYPQKEVQLNSLYAVPNAKRKDYGISDGISGFDLEFDLSLDKTSFGNVHLQYRGGDRIDGFSLLDNTTATIQQDSKIGDAIIFQHQSRNVPVGLIIFDSKVLRQNFMDSYYRFNTFLDGLNRGKKFPINKN